MKKELAGRGTNGSRHKILQLTRSRKNPYNPTTNHHNPEKETTMCKLYAGNGNPPPKDPPKREVPPPVEDPQETDAGNGNPPPPDKIK